MYDWNSFNSTKACIFWLAVRWMNAYNVPANKIAYLLFASFSYVWSWYRVKSGMKNPKYVIFYALLWFFFLSQMQTLLTKSTVFFSCVQLFIFHVGLSYIHIWLMLVILFSTFELWKPKTSDKNETQWVESSTWDITGTSLLVYLLKNDCQSRPCIFHVHHLLRHIVCL